MRLLILFAAVAFCYGAETEAERECSWGPTYWCSSVKSAKNCGAVQFCIRNTWSQSLYTQDIHADDTCTFCKKIVNDVREFITSDDAEHQIIAFADRQCARFPQQFIADECKGVVNLYVVQIIQMLRQNMNDAAVCHSLNLCVSSDMFTAPFNFRDHFAVSQQFITQMAVDKLKAAKIDEQFQALARNTAAHGSALTQTLVPPFVGSASDQCNTCKEGVADLKVVFSDAHVRDEITSILKQNLCPRFVLPAECNKLVDDYAPEVYQVLNNLDPLAACETIGLCKVIANPSANLVHVELRPDTNDLTVEEPPVKASAQCILCEYVVSTVFQALENNKTDAEVIATVTNICKHLPSSIGAECTQFVEEYGQELIDLITHSADPETICATIGLCGTQNAHQNIVPNNEVNEQLAESMRPFMNVGPVLNGFEGNSYQGRIETQNFDANNKCLMCRIVANYLIALLNENVTATILEKGLDKACDVLPGELEKEVCL